MTAMVASPRRRGRPPSCPPDVVLRIVSMRRAGLSLQQISATLNADSIPTPAGGKRWQRSYVDRLLHTRYALECATQVKAETEIAPQSEDIATISTLAWSRR
jgi:hypothetical protein